MQPKVYSSATAAARYTNLQREPRAAVRCSVWLGVLLAGLTNAPLKSLAKISETSRANPAIFVFCAITLMENIRIILDHEFREAELAMIMIPIGLGWIATILFANEQRPLKEALLSH